VRVSNFLPANASDTEILDLARHEGRVVITQDVDFSALLALGGQNQPSLVTLRLLNTDPDVVTARLREVFPRVENALRQGSAVTVEEDTVRVRQLPIR
jgi:predicted nuclease of predicted toxin-antitoxin system